MKNLFLFFLLITTSILYGQKFISFTGSNSAESIAPQIHITDAGLNGIQIDYKFTNATSETFFETLPNGTKEEFQLLTISGFSHLQQPGKAALPSKIELIAVPKGATYQLEIVGITRQLQKGYKIYPARQPARDTEGAAEPSFEYDQDYYKTNSFLPASPVEIIETIEIRGMSFLMIQVTPIQYNPVTSEIYTLSALKFKVKFVGGSRFFDYENHSQNFLNTLMATPLNANGFKADFGSWSAKNLSLQSSFINTDYLIITQDSFLVAADSLANWKRQMGYGVEVLSAPVWTSATVKAAIYNKYQNINPKPDYFVIVGDVQQVPPEIFLAPDASGNYGTDLYYACMGGSTDYVPEMAHGRISVSTAAQALMVVQKIINYERSPIADTNFYKNGLNCAMFQDDDFDGYADRRFVHTSEDVRNYMMSHGYNVQRIYYADNNIYPNNYNASYYSNGQAIPAALLKTNGYLWNGGATNIKNAINEGRFCVLHRDHGYSGGTGWAHPAFLSSNISQLSNGNKLPVVFSINCHTGEFTLSNCFAETFLRHPNGGAVGVFAASYYSYSGYNDGLTGGLFDAMWSNPGLIPAFGSGGIVNPQVTAHSDIINMGFVLNHGLLRMTQTWGGNSNDRKYSYRLFHYFGDPAMRLWTEQPQSLVAFHSATINCFDTVFTITNCNDSNAIATLMGNGELLGKANIINGSGAIFVPMVIGQTLKLTITARNRVPYTANITVNSGGGLSILATIKNNTCFGDSAGSIRILPSCGNPPYQISWAGGSTELYRDSLKGGTYIVTVTDSALAVLVDTFTVWSPTAPLTSAPSVHDAKCFFESTGTIILNLNGGATPYNFKWSHGSTGAIAHNLSAGNYSVIVTDSVGCKFNQTFTINQPLPLDLNATAVDDIANNCTGSGEAIATGGTLPYSFSWNDPANQTTAIATGLCKGLYKVTLNDSNQCIQYRTIIVNNTIGIDENENEADFVLFPNPADDHILIKSLGTHSLKLEICLYNTVGQELLRTREEFDQNNEIRINLNQFNNGVYYLIIDSNNGENFTQKVLINRVE